MENLVGLLGRCTPLGLVVVDSHGAKELVKPKSNPYLSTELKDYFLANLHSFAAYTKYKVNPIQ